METYKIEGGLIVNAKKKGQCAGYIFNFGGHGAFDPVGLVQANGRAITDAEIKTHNGLLEQAELEAYKKAGKGTFYLTREKNEAGVLRHYVGTWAGGWKTMGHVNSHLCYGYARTERRHVHFTGPDGKPWYGINQGDHQLVRARRRK